MALSSTKDVTTDDKEYNDVDVKPIYPLIDLLKAFDFFRENNLVFYNLFS